MANRLSTFTLLSLSVVSSSIAACGAPSSVPSSPSGTGTATAVSAQTVHGTVTLAAYATDNPVVVGRTADGRSFFAPIQGDGTFALTLPAGASAQLSIANTTRAESYQVISKILWPGVNDAWARLDGTTASIALGHVQPVASGNGGVQVQDHGSPGSSESNGSSGGSENESAEADGGDDGAGELHACGTAAPGRSDLPYDVQPAVGSTFRLNQAFLAKGPAPKAITAVTMQGGSWRLAELQNDTPFVVTDADCTHQGNRDIGRDRIFVTWTNADGSSSTDHLDLRYCDGSGAIAQDDAGTSSGGGSNGGGAGGGSNGGGGDDNGGDQGMAPDDCESDGTPVCSVPGAGESHCDGTGSAMDADDAEHGDDPSCTVDGGAPSPRPSADGGATPLAPSPSPTPPGAGNGASAGGGQAGDACTVNADCSVGLACLASVCGTQTVIK